MISKISFLSGFLFLCLAYSVSSAQVTNNTNNISSVSNLVTQTNQCWISGINSLNDPGVKIFLIFISFVNLIILMLLLGIRPQKNKIMIRSARILKVIIFFSFLALTVLLLSIGERVITLILTILIICFYFIASEMASNSVTINTFSVPESFLKKHPSYTGQVLAWHIIDEIYKINNSAEEFEKKTTVGNLQTDEMSLAKYAPNQEPGDISVDFGKVSFSINSVIKYLKKTGCMGWLFKGKNYIVDGEITENYTKKSSRDIKWFLTLRVQEKNKQISDKFLLDDDIKLFDPGVFVLVNTDPNKAERYFKIAYNCKVQGNLEEAIKEYNIAIKYKPDYAMAHNNLGVAYYNKGEFDKAIEEYQSAIKYKPDYAMAHNNLGVTYYNKGEFDKAIEEYQSAIKYKPDYAMAHNNLGIAYDKKGEFDKAIEEYQTVIKYKPDYTDAYYNLACAYSKLGKIKQAYEKLKLSVDNGYSDFNNVENDTDLINLRNDPGWTDCWNSIKNKISKF